MSISALAKQLGQLLQQQSKQVTTAESCTGGGIAEAITRIAGSSAWFEAGYVTYSNQQKTKMLQVPEEMLAKHGAVSLPVVEAMAQGAQQASGAYYAVAVSGIAGPDGGSIEKPVGTVCFAWVVGQQTYSETQRFTGDRAAVRQQAVQKALLGLISLMTNK